MEIFLYAYIIIQPFGFFLWVHNMFCSTPIYGRGKTRFSSNWKEGGNLGLVMCIVLSLALSVIISLVAWMLNF